MDVPAKEIAPSRLYGGEAPDVRQARRRAAFIAAGLTLFGTVGYRKTNMRSLCKAAGLTDRYFYESFVDMEDLLEAVYDERIGQMQSRVLAAINAVDDKSDWDAMVTAALNALFKFVEDPVTARVVWLEVLGVSPRIDQRYAASLQLFVNFLQQLTQHNFPKWIPDDTRSSLVSRAVVSAVSGSAVSWFLSNYREPRDEVISALKIVFNGLLLQAKISQ
jgi:AcrR family transcriptional regulator